jgi:hypothetical protein
VFRITLPLSLPGVVAIVVYAFATTWNEFIFALVFAQDSQVKTLPIGIAEFSTEFDTDWGAVMAASMVMTLPVAIVFLLIPPDAAAVRRRPDGRRHQRLIIVAPVSNGSVGRRPGRSRLNRRAGAARPCRGCALRRGRRAICVPPGLVGVFGFGGRSGARGMRLL